MPSRKKWTKKELKTRFPKRLREELRRRGHPPDELPSHKLVRELGFGGAVNATRRELGLTLHEFLVQECGFIREESSKWPGEDSRTNALLEEYLELHTTTRKNEDSTARSERSRLKTMLQYHIDVVGHGDLIQTANGGRGAGYPTLLRIFDKRVDEEHETDQSCLQYARSLVRFFDWAERRGYADHNPAEDALEDMGWEDSSSNPRPATHEEVRKLWSAAESIPDSWTRRLRKVMLILLGGGGTRPDDAVSIDGRHDVYFGEDSYIQYGESRKNGPGTAALMVGESLLKRHIAELNTREDWDGALLPSREGGSITTGTLRNWFVDLAERADVTVDGKPMRPRFLRKFWYTQYMDARRELLSHVQEVATEQGSSSHEVVLESYLDQAVIRRWFRDYARDRFEAAFPEEIVTRRPRESRPPGEMSLEEVRARYSDEVDSTPVINEIDDPNQTSIDDFDEGSLIALPSSLVVALILHVTI